MAVVQKNNVLDMLSNSDAKADSQNCVSEKSPVRKRQRISEDSSFIIGEPPAKKSSDENGSFRETCTVPAPFSTDEAACLERDSIDYSIKITKTMAEAGQAPRPIRIYADGIYDMFHSGHARQLMQAKKCFPGVYLIVGVCDDELTHERKGRTVMNEAERYEAIRHCRYVDELVAAAPWEIDDEYLLRHKIDFVAHDDLPYGADDQEDIYKWLKDRGMFVATQRTEGISTTDVIARIIRDYDVYIRRNLARGYTAKDLNVSFMREKRIQFQEKVDKVKGKLVDKRDKLMDKGSDILHKWEERSKEFVGNFVELFGRDSRFNQWFTESRLRVARAISPPGSPSQPGKPSSSPGEPSSSPYFYELSSESEDDNSPENHS